MKKTKTAAKLASRRKVYDALQANNDGFKRPGSMNPHKQGSSAKRSGPNARERSRAAVAKRA